MYSNLGLIAWDICLGPGFDTHQVWLQPVVSHSVISNPTESLEVNKTFATFHGYPLRRARKLSGASLQATFEDFGSAPDRSGGLSVCQYLK